MEILMDQDGYVVGYSHVAGTIRQEGCTVVEMDHITPEFEEDFWPQKWVYANGELVASGMPKPEPLQLVTDHALLDAALPLLRMQAAEAYTDEQLIEAAVLFAGTGWEPGKSYSAKEVLLYEGQMYQVMQAHVSQAHQPPGSTGMAAVYRPVVVAHAGTLEDPVPFVYEMDVSAGLYYLYDGRVYLAKRDMTPCVWYPGTAPNEWEEVAG